MSADPAEPYEIIPPHAESAAIIPLGELRMLKVLEDAASPEDREGARIVAEYLADKEGMRARATVVRTEEDLEAMLDAYEAGHPCA